MKRNILKSRLVAAAIDLPIISTIWLIYWLFVASLADKLARIEETDMILNQQFTVGTIFSMLASVVFFPYILLIFREDKLPGYANQNLALLNKSRLPASILQKLIRVAVILAVSGVVFGVVIMFKVWVPQNIVSLWLNEEFTNFVSYCCLVGNLVLYTTYFLLLVVEVITGKYLPNWIAKTQVLQYKITDIDL